MPTQTPQHATDQAVLSQRATLFRFHNKAMAKDGYLMLDNLNLWFKQTDGKVYFEYKIPEIQKFNVYKNRDFYFQAAGKKYRLEFIALSELDSAYDTVGVQAISSMGVTGASGGTVFAPIREDSLSTLQNVMNAQVPALMRWQEYFTNMNIQDSPEFGKYMNRMDMLFLTSVILFVLIVIPITILWILTIINPLPKY